MFNLQKNCKHPAQNRVGQATGGMGSDDTGLRKALSELIQCTLRIHRHGADWAGRPRNTR
jgi:hypothetical protein